MSINDSNVPNWHERFKQLALDANDFRLRQYYEAGAVKGDTPVSDVPFVALDFETTGLNANKHSIVSIGAVPFKLGRIYCNESAHWVVNPTKPLDSASVIIHGITHAEIDHAPDFIQIFEQLLELLSGRVVVVHHRSIERSFLEAALLKRLGESIEFPVIDTMELEARLHRKPRTFWQTIRGVKPVSIRLADSRLRYGLPHYGQHHALTDALASAELLQAQILQHCGEDMLVEKLWW